jgi:hypothetical protein
MFYPNGTRVRGNWGAMLANDYGTVIGHDPQHGHLIKWDDDHPRQGYHNVLPCPPRTGSPIGVFLEKERTA